MRHKLSFTCAAIVLLFGSAAIYQRASAQSGPGSAATQAPKQASQAPKQAGSPAPKAAPGTQAPGQGSSQATTTPAATDGCSGRHRVKLQAATLLDTAGKPTEVRLRWMPRRGWMPDVVFNLYRTGADGKHLLMHGEAPGNAPIVAKAATDFKYLETLSQVKRSVALDAGPVGNPEPIHRMESGPAFTAMGKKITDLRRQQAQAEGPKVLPQNSLEQVLNIPEVKKYRDMLKIGNPVGAKQPGTAAKPMTEEERRTAAARSNLHLAAMIHPEIRSDLGFAFDDKTAQTGLPYTYELRVVEKGQECPVPVGSLQFIVGKDPAIPEIKPLTAAQIDEDTVDLRWTRPASEAELLPTYQITRVNNSQGTVVTPKAIAVADIKLAVPQTADQKTITHVEPRAFYSDRGVAPGPVTYKVTMTDIFGRTATATLDFNVTDWHSPAPSEKVWAELKHYETPTIRDDVIVRWTESPEKGVAYRVYRVTVDDNTSKPKLVEALGALPSGATPGEKSEMPAELQGMARSKVPAAASARSGGKPTSGQYSAEPPHAAENRRAAWLAFTDTGVKQGHIYRYFVTATYQTRNKLDSIAASSQNLAVPDTTLLAGPLNLRFKLGPASSVVKAQSAKNAMEIKAAQPHYDDWQKTVGVRSEEQSATKQGVTKPGATKPGVAGSRDTNSRERNLREINLGGSIQLNWDPVAHATLYRIYRANASGYFNVSSLAGGVQSAESEVRLANRPGEGAAAASARAPRNGVSEPTHNTINRGALGSLNNNPNVLAKFGRQDLQGKYGIMRYFPEIAGDDIPDSSYALVGQVVNGTVFEDYYPRSQAHTYVYRVVAVNRWNVPGRGMVKGARYSSLSVPVPSTLPPGPPVLLSVRAREDGYLSLKFRGNLGNQGVGSYHIFRRDMPVVYHTQIFKVAGEIPVDSVAASGNKTPSGDTTIKPPAMIVIHPVSNAIVPSIGQGRDMPVRGTIREARPIALPAALSPFFFERTDYKEMTKIDAQAWAKRSKDGEITIVDDTVLPMREYFYYVVADNGNAKYESKPSNILNGIPLKVRADAPAAFKASPAPVGVVLSWNATVPGAQYIVQRAVGTSEDFIQLSGASPETTYNDYSARRGRPYVYRIIAIENGGQHSDPGAYPLDQMKKDPTKYPARATVTWPVLNLNPKGVTDRVDPGRVKINEPVQQPLRKISPKP
jgi:hypothetical protein